MLTEGDFESLSGNDIYLNRVSPKDKPWDDHRVEAERVRDLYKGTEFDRYADRIDACSRLLQFKFIAREDGALGLKLDAAPFCRVRFCTICQWRRQMMWRARFFQALPQILADNPKVRFLFLTLTVRNCAVSELHDQLAWMNRSWQRLSQRRVFPALGWLKSVEVTRSTLGEAHPHFHAILAVNPSYFSHGYISKEKWVQLWRESLQVNYDPSVDIRVIKSKSDSFDDVASELSRGFCEVLKYAIKPGDLISDREWLLEITSQLHKTRAVSVGGMFRKYISDKEPEDLIGEDDNPEFDSEGIIWFGWREKLQHYIKVDQLNND